MSKIFLVYFQERFGSGGWWGMSVNSFSEPILNIILRDQGHGLGVRLGSLARVELGWVIRAHGSHQGYQNQEWWNFIQLKGSGQEHVRMQKIRHNLNQKGAGWNSQKSWKTREAQQNEQRTETIMDIRIRDEDVSFNWRNGNWIGTRKGAGQNSQKSLMTHWELEIQEAWQDEWTKLGRFWTRLSSWLVKECSLSR